MSNKLFSWIIFIVLCIIWGSSFKLMRDGTLGLTAGQIAAVRIFSAGLVFVPFALFHFRKLPANRMALIIFSAVLGNLLPAFLFATAMTRLDGSLGGILNALTPIWVVVVGVLFYRDRIATQKIVGVVTGFLGLVLLTIAPVLQAQRSISFDNLVYTSFILVATFLYGVNVNMVSHRLKGLNPVHVATVSLAFMTIPAGIILWQQGFFSLDFSAVRVQHAVLSATILGVLGSAVATILLYMLVQRAGGLFASLVTYGIPFVALAWGFSDGESIGWLKIFCLLLILLGVYLANRRKGKGA